MKGPVAISDMYSPSPHEQNASSALQGDDTATATVSALLAIASAIERLADVLDRQE